MTRSRNVWMIGAGNMGGAILRRWQTVDDLDQDVHVVARSLRNVPAGISASTEVPLADAPKICFLAIKPQSLPEVAIQLAKACLQQTVMVSMLAGVDIATLETLFPVCSGFVRIMPNLPVEIGKGVIPIFANSGSEDAVLQVIRFLEPLGMVERLAIEESFHVVTAIVGGGPAFFFRFMDAISQILISRGFSGPLAEKLTRDIILRPKLFTEPSSRSLATKDAGIDCQTQVLLDNLVKEAVRASARRSLEMSIEAMSAAAEY